MARDYIDISGQRFGMLTVIERSDVRNTSNQRKWLCKCDCGGTAYYTLGQLRGGGAKSCGCLRPEGAKRVEGLTVPPEFADCVCVAPPDKYLSGCEALVELVCAKKGKCSFYKSRSEEEY